MNPTKQTNLGHKNPNSSEQRLLAAGFKLEDTGGGCTAYIRETENSAGVDKAHIVITVEDGSSAPQTFGIGRWRREAILVGFYDILGDKLATLRFPSVIAFLDSLQEE